MFDRFKSSIRAHKSGSAVGASPNQVREANDARERPQGAEVAAETRQQCHVVSRQENSITFAVDEVARATRPLWTSRLDQSFELRTGIAPLQMPEADVPALAPEGYAATEPVAAMRQPNRVMTGIATTDDVAEFKQRFARTRFLHPVIEAVHLAFSDHRPLIFSPDAIWMTIVQGFGHHVIQNAETLRDRIVMHDRQKKLTVRVDSLQIDWPTATALFSAAIKENSDPVLHETLMCEFSTTTPRVKTAYEVALMDTYQPYFKYEVECICGIPEITLEGTADDWRRMRERIEVLATYDLGWWTSRLAPILNEFIATANGQPDLAFWQAIYKPREVYSRDYATGWITDLFPYLVFLNIDEERLASLKPTLHRNPIFKAERMDWLPVATRVRPDLQEPGVRVDYFPSGLSCAPVTIRFEDASTTDVELLGGFVGVSQRAEDCALCPIIGWAVVPAQSGSSLPAPAS